MTVMPCPHCGMRETFQDWDGWRSAARAVRTSCLACRTAGPLMGTEADAVHAWNRLALATSIAEAAWLEREAEHAGYTTAVHGQRARQLESCARLEKRRLLDAWGEDGPA